MRALRFAVPLLGAVLILGTVLLGQQLGTTAPTPPQAVAGATSATRVCPALTGGEDGGSVVVDSLSAPPESAVQLQRADGTELGTVPGGQLRSVAVEESATTIARANGDAATLTGQSSLAEQTSGSKRGLMVSPCVSASTEAWFTGFRSNDTERAVLLITNPDSEAAEVSLNIYTAEGLAAVAGTSGIAVQPGETREVPMESLLSSDDPLAVQVLATSGRVSAAAEVETGTGSDPAGADWVAGAGLTDTTVVIPGVPGGDGSRELVVANPGDQRNQVSVELLGSDGAFPPADADQLDLAAESVGSVELAEAAAGEPVAVRITAEQPVTAGVVSRSTDDAASSDVSYSPASTAVGAFGVAAVGGLADHRGTLVVSSSAAVESSYEWQAYGEDGSVVGEGTETVPAEGTSAVQMPDEGQLAVHITPVGDVELFAGIALAGDVDEVSTLSAAPITASRVLQEDPPQFDPEVAR